MALISPIAVIREGGPDAGSHGGRHPARRTRPRSINSPWETEEDWLNRDKPKVDGDKRREADIQHAGQVEVHK